MTNTAQDTINQKQDAIIASFKILSGDRAMMIEQLMEFGNQLPPLAPCYKIDANLVPGCLSSVWLIDKEEDGCLFFQADSDAMVTKGLIALLIQILSGQPVKAISQANLYFIDQLHMVDLISFQRANGLASMIHTIKQKALYRSSLME